MGRPDVPLASLLSDEDLPTHDAVFVLGVLARIERRRLILRTIAHIPIALAIAAILWAGKTFTLNLPALTVGLPGAIVTSAVILTVLFLISCDSESSEL
jgi:hypothetical protein